MNEHWMRAEPAVGIAVPYLRLCAVPFQETASARPSGHNHDDTCSASSHPSQVKDDDTCIASSQPSPAKDERTADAADERSQATTQIRQQDDRFCLELTSLPFYAE